MATVDEKVVELRLDDSQFDKASDRTIRKLDDLKAALKFDGAVGSFKEIDKAAKDVELSPLEKGVAEVTRGFSVLESVAFGALTRIGSQAVDTGERLIKSLTIDNISAGWGKYEQKVAAVQTIMSATSNQFSDTGKQMTFVEEQLKTLNWFTDETSYKFLDMVNNIGKFTNSGVELKTAVKAMEGISTWAAISGANVNEAGRAMYNLSQAMGVGAVTLMDWKSIENANMGTIEFKQTVIDTATEMGLLTKVAENTWQTLSGKEVSAANFREALSDKWFTSDVLIKALETYGGFADRLGEITDEYGLMTTQVLGFIDEYLDGTIDIAKAAEEMGISVQEATDILEELGDAQYELGRRSFRAAQETKTFTEAIDYVKEAVGSGWMQTFELIFGNYTEAKVMWSDLSEVLYEVFVESGNARNGLLEAWKAAGGRDDLIEGAKNLLKSLYQPVEIISNAFRRIFPKTTVDDLLNITKVFEKITEQLRLSEGAATSLENAFAGLFAFFKAIFGVIGAVIAGLDPLLNTFNRLGGIIIGLLGDIGLLSSTTLGGIFDKDLLTTIYNIVYKISSVLSFIIELVTALAMGGIAQIAGFVSDIWASFKAGEGGITGFFKAIFDNFAALFERISNGESIINRVIDTVKNLVKSLVDAFKNSSWIDISGVGGFFGSIVKFVNDSGIVDGIGVIAGALGALTVAIFDFVGGINDADSEIRRVIDAFIGSVSFFWEWLTDNLANMTIRDVADVAILIFVAQFVKSLTDLNKKFSGAVGGFQNVLNSLANTISSYAQGGPIDKLSKGLSDLGKNTKWAQVALAIGAMVKGLLMLSEVPAEQLGTATAAIAATIGMVILLLKVLEKLGQSGGGNQQAETAADKLIKFSLSVGILSASVSLLAKSLEGDGGVNRMVGAIGALGTIMAAVMLFAYGIDKIKIDGAKLMKVSAAILVLTTSVNLLVPAVAGLSLLDTNGVLGAASAISILILSFGALGALMQNTDWKVMLSASATILSISAALVVMAGAVGAFAAIALAPTFATGLLGVVSSLGALVLALGLLSYATQGSSAVDILSISVGVVALAGALNLIAVACAAFMLIDPDAVVVAMGALLGAVVAFGVVAAIAQATSTGLLALAAVIVAIGASFLLTATAVDTIVTAIGKLMVILAAFMVGVNEFGDDLMPMLEKAFDAFEWLFVKVLELFPKYTYELTRAATALISALISGLTVGLLNGIPDVVAGFMAIAIAVLDVIARLGGPFIDALTRAIEGMNEGIPQLMFALGDFVEEVFEGLGVILRFAIAGLIEGILEALGLGFMADGVREWAEQGFKEPMVNVIAETGQAAQAEIENSFDNAQAALEEGAKDTEVTAENAGDIIGQAVVGGFKDSVGDHSPWDSILESFKNAGLGFEFGTDSILEIAANSGYLAGSTWSSGLTAGMSEGVFGFENFLSTFFGYAPQAPADIGNERGASTQQALHRTYLTSGLSAKDQAKAAKQQQDQSNQDGFDAGESWMNGFGDGLLSGGGGYSSAYSSSNTIRDIYMDALDEIDRRAETSELQYESWTTFNQAATQVEKDTKELEQANAQYEFQLERMQIAETYWQDTVKKYGENSVEAAEAQQTFLQVQIETEQMRQELVEMMENTNQQLEDLDRQANISQAEYEYWQTMNEDAEDFQKLARQISYSNEEILREAQRLDIARKTWVKAQEQYGVDSREATDAYYEYLTQMNKLQKLQNEMADLQDEYNDALEDSLTHRSELEKRADLGATTRELEYQIWGLQHGDASDMEKRLAELRYLSGELDDANLKLAFASDDYHKAVEKYGENSFEALEAHNTYLAALADQMQVQDEITQAQSAQAEDMQEAWKAAGKMASQNFKDLIALGFSADQIVQSSLDYYGIPKPDEVKKATEEANDEMQKTATKAASKTTQAYKEAVTSGVESTKPVFTQAGADYIETLTNSMVSDSSMSMIQQTITSIVEETYTYATSDRMIDFWIEIGEEYMNGMITGVEKLSGKFLDTITNIIERALAMAKAAAGIASPSKETTWIGEMLDRGLIRGVTDYGPAVVACMKNLVDDVVKVPMDKHTSSNLEFAGSLIAGGIAAGMDSYTYKVTHASQDLLDQMTEEFDNTLTGNQKFWDALSSRYGLDREDFSYEVVLSFNTDRAWEDMTEFERAVISKLSFNAAMADMYMSGGLEYVESTFEAWYDEHSNDLQYRNLPKLEAIAERMENASNSGVLNTAKYEYTKARDRWLAIWTEEKDQYETERRAAEEQYWDTYRMVIDGIEAMKEDSKEQTSVQDSRVSYTQNIYSEKPLSTLDVYRNTNKLLMGIS